LYSGFGSRQVSTIYGTGDSFAVLIEFDEKVQLDDGELPDVRIRNSEGKLVPIGAFARSSELPDHWRSNQLGQLPAVTCRSTFGRRRARRRGWRASTN